MKPRMFIMLFICHAVPLFIGMGLFPLLPLYAARFGAIRTDIGVFYAVVYIASTAGVFGTGWLAARVSRRALFFAGATLGIPALVLMGHATALWQVVLLTACVWLCGGITLTLLSVFTGVLRDPRIVRAPARPSGNALPIRLGHSFTLLLVASLLAFAATSIGRLGISLSM